MVLICDELKLVIQNTQIASSSGNVFIVACGFLVIKVLFDFSCVIL
jgi:hypothetical protein